MNKLKMVGNTAMTFGEAVQVLNAGGIVQRQGWNGKGLFVFKQIPATIHKDIVPKMQSLPEVVKQLFQARFDDPSEQIDSIYYNNQLALVGPSNTISGWSPSTSDSLATDWVELVVDDSSK